MASFIFECMTWFKVQCTVGKKREYDSVFWIQFSYSGIVNLSEMPIPMVGKVSCFSLLIISR